MTGASPLVALRVAGRVARIGHELGTYLLGRGSTLANIPLPHGRTTVVSDEDAELAKLRWSQDARGYVKRSYRTQGRDIYERLHRVIAVRAFGPVASELHVDHINRNKLDNRRENLRVAHRWQNLQNAGARSRGSSGFKGVHWSVQHQSWRVKASANGKHAHIGLFKDKEQAARAYDSWVKAHAGSFAHLNFPNE